MTRSILPLLCAATCWVGCLPADTRPVPAHVLVSVARDPELGDGAATFLAADGWRLTVSTLVITMGNVGFSSDTCNEYSEARYRRLLDLNRPGPQKLAEVYGLAACTLSYGVMVAEEDTVLGQGLTLADLEFMRSATVRVSSDTGLTTTQGMALHLVGQAEKDGTTVQFDWGFVDRLRFSDCQRSASDPAETTLALESGQALDLSITVDPRNLFQIGLDPKLAPPLDVSDAMPMGEDTEVVPTLDLPPMSLTQWIADADQVTGDGNGRVSVDELAQMAIPGAASQQNLAEILRLFAYPTLFRYDDDGQCSNPIGQRRGHGGGDFF
jgi:hypothetical protein